MCFGVRSEDLSLVDDAGARAVHAGLYALEFFDGNRSVSMAARVPAAAARVLSRLPPVDNPQPPCCQGEERGCC